MFSLDYIRGKGRLVKAFWIYGVITAILCFPILGTIALSINKFAPYALIPTMYVLLPILYAIWTFGFVAIWQCAWNCRNRFWSWLVVVILLLTLIPPFKIADYVEAKDLYTFIINWLRLITFVAAIAGVFLYGNFATRCYRFIVPLFLAVISTIQAAEHARGLHYPMMAELKNGNYVESYDINKISKSLSAESIQAKLDTLEEAAYNGNIKAAYLIGAIYGNDDRVRDDVKAFQWMQHAVQHGYPHAKNDLAIYYERGIGIDKNPAMMMQLFNEAYAEGDYFAAYNIGLQNELGRAIPRNYELAASYYQKTIDKSAMFSELNCAMNDLGALYATGKGVTQDDKKALKLFTDAAMKEIKIELPDDYKISYSHHYSDFPAAYAKYRLAVSQGKSISDLKLTPEMLVAVKLVADKYNETCRS